MVEQMLERWRGAGVAVNPGASAGDLAWLEQHVGALLPEDVRRYFLLADGMADGEVDDSVAAFWSIDRIRREVSDDGTSYWSGLPGHTPIADVLIHSWFICLQVAESGSLVVVSEPRMFEFPSLSEFCDRYVTAPDSLGLLAEGEPSNKQERTRVAHGETERGPRR